MNRKPFTVASSIHFSEGERILKVISLFGHEIHFIIDAVADQ